MVHLGDGMTRVGAGESLSLEHTEMLVDSTRSWNRRGALGLSDRGDQRPAHPPALASENIWSFCDGDLIDVRDVVVERREIYGAGGIGCGFENNVVVFREGLALPTRELLRVVNNAHAVLVLRGGTKKYFYLRRDGFVLSTREEQALMEWGVGRPLLANFVLAAGGTFLVALAERFWGPAVVGLLLVALAGYRVQGALTKLLRVRSREWKSGCMLVPSGLHGAERALQGVLVTLVALAGLLDNKWVLLGTLAAASVQVFVVECIGQAALTWGSAKYIRVLYHHLLWCTVMSLYLVCLLWFTYACAGILGACVLGVLLYCINSSLLISGCLDARSSCFKVSAYLALFSTLGLGIWATVVGWDEAEMKYTFKSLQPWRWPLLSLPVSLASFLRVSGLWIGVVSFGVSAAYCTGGVLFFRVSSDGGEVVGWDERTQARLESSNFSHYHEKSIPSRNLLESSSSSGVGRPARDAGQPPPPPVALVA